MYYLFQSAFLQALGYAIANSLWQTAMLWLVYMLVSHVLKLGAARKYMLAVAMQLLGFCWFVVTLQFYHLQYSRLLSEQTVAAGKVVGYTTLLTTGEGVRATMLKLMIAGEQLLPYLSIAYLLLMVALVIRWVMGYRNTQKIRTEGIVKIPVHWRLFVNDTAKQMGITRNIRIFLSEKITTPLTIGCIKPIILVPIASINHLSVAQLEAVILHELAHIKRFDYLVNMLLSIVEIALFFNPFTQLLAKSIRKERENSCDDWVLQFQYAATTYAEALLRIAQMQYGTPSLVMAAAKDQKHELLSRVKRMIEQKEQQFNYRRQLMAFLLVTGILSSIAWFNPGTHQLSAKASTNKTQQSKNTIPQPIQPVVVEPMALKVSNPLFNPAFFITDKIKQEMKSDMEKAASDIKATFNDKAVTASIQAIPAAMKEAYETVSPDFLQDKIDWTKHKADMEQAKTDIRKAIKELDTVNMPVLLRKPIQENLRMSLDKMEKELVKVQTDVLKQQKFKMHFQFDEVKIGKDIEAAFQSLEKLDLEKIMRSLPMSEFLDPNNPSKLKISEEIFVKKGKEMAEQIKQASKKTSEALQKLEMLKQQKLLKEKAVEELEGVEM